MWVRATESAAMPRMESSSTKCSLPNESRKSDLIIRALTAQTYPSAEIVLRRPTASCANIFTVQYSGNLVLIEDCPKSDWETDFFGKAQAASRRKSGMTQPNGSPPPMGYDRNTTDKQGA